MAAIAQPMRRTAQFMAPRSDLAPLALLLVVTLAPIFSIHAAGWAPGTEVLFAVGGLAVLAAFWLSRSRVRTRTVVGIGAVLDLAVAYVVASEAFPGPFDAIPNFVALFGNTIEWVQLRQAGVFDVEQPLAGALSESTLLIQDLYFRLESWFQAAFELQVSRDNVVFIFWMTMAAWGMGYFASLAIFRQRSVMLAVMPATLAIGINVTYIGPAWVPFAVFLFAALALAVHTRMWSLQSKWSAAQAAQRVTNTQGLVTPSAVVIAAVVLLSVALPRTASNPLADTFWTYLGDGWGNVETGLQRMFGGISNPSGTSLTGRQSMPVLGPQPFGQTGSLIIESTSPSYWRGQTFDTYTGQGWRSSYRELAERTSQQVLNEEIQLRARLPVRTNVEIIESNSPLLYAPGDAVRLNIRNFVQVEDREAPIDDYSSIRATRRVGSRLIYSVDSTISQATAAQLRTAPLEYPLWVERYVQLPQMTARVLELARRIAESGDNSHDRAEATAAFLRRFPFAVSVPRLPEERDAADFFLFDVRRGHPAVMASTMAVLLRAMDIPARVATGYATGTLEPVSGRYVVNPSDTHVWTEVYFPEYGWVPYEPSGFRAALGAGRDAGFGGAGGFDPEDLGDPSAEDLMDADRLLEELDAMGLEGVFAPATPIQDNPFVDFINNLSLAALIGSALLAVFVALLVGVVVVSLVRSRLREPSAAIQRIYFRMLRDARRAGYNASAALTPWELGRELSADLFPTPGSGAALAGASAAPAADAPEAPPEIVAGAFVTATYSNHRVTKAYRREVERAWRDTRRKLLRRIVTRPRWRRAR